MLWNMRVHWLGRWSERTRGTCLLSEATGHLFTVGSCCELNVAL